MPRKNPPLPPLVAQGRRGRSKGPVTLPLLHVEALRIEALPPLLVEALVNPLVNLRQPKRM